MIYRSHSLWPPEIGFAAPMLWFQRFELVFVIRRDNGMETAQTDAIERAIWVCSMLEGTIGGLDIRVFHRCL
jgi:hypothetical protein